MGVVVHAQVAAGQQLDRRVLGHGHGDHNALAGNEDVRVLEPGQLQGRCQINRFRQFGRPLGSRVFRLRCRSRGRTSRAGGPCPLLGSAVAMGISGSIGCEPGGGTTGKLLLRSARPAARLPRALFEQTWDLAPFTARAHRTVGES